MAIIALVGNKGGAGKTTLAVNLAFALARSASTALLDADPQGSALQWQTLATREDGPDAYDASVDLEGLVAQLAPHYSHLIIDCPPSVHAPQTHAALRVCNLALVPVQPSPVDLWATVHIANAVEAARGHNPTLTALLVINQLESRTTLSRLMPIALAELELPVAKTALRRRAIYRASAVEGKSVLDMGKRGTDAADELNQLINEVLSQ
ncbi:MAG: cobyrinic acid a,c-diamide synthase [Gammaproteobacteria bacterium SG8_47]|nr:MAG: cobyrinic acid a,c-diamide synthase [Gammaproteobacteria bacterium SG8_47]